MPRFGSAAARAAAVVAVALVGAACADTVVHSERSLYRNVIVYEEDGLRCMKFTRFHASGRQTCQSLREPDRLVFGYARMMMGALYVKPDPKSILVVGLGGGTLPMALARVVPEAQIDSVEIDAAVVRVAQRFFGFRPSATLRVFEQDGRVFVKRAGRTDARYDIVMLDAFDHEYIPEHLLTREFLSEVKALLAPDGVVAANTFSGSRLYEHESATYASVFGRFYNLKSGNRVIIATAGDLPPRDVLARNAGFFEARFRALGFGGDRLLPLFSTERDWRPDARILTDQYSPANLLNATSS
jgi:spermidine synthase